MSTNAQIAANQKNSQLSTGPVTPEGKQRSSQNATRHGLTGLTLVLTPEERDAYQSHVKGYLDEYEPEGQKQIQLVQQITDLHWSFHQIFVQQSNTLSLMNAVRAQMDEAGDAVATAAALAPLARTLNTLNLYEVRRRRAAQTVEAEFAAIQQAAFERQGKELPQAAAFYKSYKAQGKDFNPPDFGFDCSLDDVLLFLEGHKAAAILNPHDSPMTAERFEAEMKAMEAQIDAALAQRREK